MKQFLKLLLLFAVLNFGALAIGAWLMGNPATNEWYQSANKAPWTPPNWTFGVIWFTIMGLFSFFMANVLLQSKTQKFWVILFAIQWVLNVSWNPIFFRYHLPITGLAVLIALLVILLVLFSRAIKQSVWTSLLIVPYILWMCIAISLDAYVVYMN